MAQNTMGTTTVLIDNSNANYQYIGTTIVTTNKKPDTTKPIWKIQRVSLENGVPTKIENAWSEGQRRFCMGR